jgi:hypothetical protein
MLYEVLGDIWVVQRNPYLRGRPAGQPEAPAALIDALTTACARSRSAARRSRCGARRHGGRAAGAGRPRCSASRRTSRRLGPAQAPPPRLGGHRRDNIKFDGLSRVST